MKPLFSFFVFLLFGCVKLSASTTNNVETVSMATEMASNYNFPKALLIPQDFIFTSVHITLEQEAKNFFTTDNEKAEEEINTSVKKSPSNSALHPAIHFSTQLVASCDIPKKRLTDERNVVVYFPSNTIQILFCTFRI